jgi:ribosomal protein S18 acetylase RimI-like enzyme
MPLTFRAYQVEDDYWHMREFLRELMILHGRRERSWHVARLDYARWHVCMNCAKVTLNDVAYLWEDDGKLAAFMMPDGWLGEVHFNIHPNYDSPSMVEAMLLKAEEHLCEKRPDGSSSLLVWAPAKDTIRQEILRQYGYEKKGDPEMQWRRTLDTPISDVPLAAGYSIRSLGDGLELLERCYASGLGFHDGNIAIAVDNRNDPTWYRNIQTAPLYRRDLDLVAVAPDGSIASFCTIWLDDVTRTAYFEPVATVPAHQRKGLGKAVLTEGLKRLQRMGALVGCVGGFSTAANALYQSVMGSDHDVYESWVKCWGK